MFKIKHMKTGLFKKIDGLMESWDIEGTLFTNQDIEKIKGNPFIKHLEFVKLNN